MKRVRVGFRELTQDERLAQIRAHAEQLPHGRRARYNVGCRCDLCRRANSDYENARQKARRIGLANGLVDIGKARAHARWLRGQGIGRNMIAEASKVGRNTIHELMRGTLRHIRAETERRILAVTVACAGDAALRSSRAAWRMLDELIEEGYTKTRIAAAMGYRTRALQFKRDRPITVRNAARIALAHKRLTE